MVFRLVSLVILTVVVFSISLLPQKIVADTPHKDYVYPQVEEYRSSVDATGVIRHQDYRETYIKCPVISSKVIVGIGDFVTKGQVVAQVDTELTKNVLSPAVSVGQTVSGMDSSSLSKISTVMAAYGLSNDSLGEILKQQNIDIATVTEKNEVVVPSTITAPMSGVVTGISLHEGVLTQTNEPVLTVADVSGFRAVVQVGQSQMESIHVGASAMVKGEGFGGKSYEGVVSKIYPTATRTTTGNSEEVTVSVEITLTSPDIQLKDGYSVKAEIYEAEPVKVMTIPYEAICQDSSNKEYVYVYEQGKAVRKEIQTGAEMIYSTEVSGLKQEDKIILSTEDLQENQLVLLRQLSRGGNEQ